MSEAKQRKKVYQPATQATYTTYASRLRTGTTLLMQPIIQSQTVAPSAPLPSSSSRTGRRGGVINYAEPGSGDEMVDLGPIDSDDSDFQASGGTRTALRGSRSRPNVSTPPVPPQPAEMDQSYLGTVPPARFIEPQPAIRTQHEYYGIDALVANTRQRPSLVPVRVEFETETHRVRDCFVWNLHETLIKPENFAAAFCDDLNLSKEMWKETVAGQIQAQLVEHEGVAAMDFAPDPTDYYGAQGEPIPECRVILSIDVQIGMHHLCDTIEWDLLSPLTPEEFSVKLCSELGLVGEAIPLVAHAVHEELIKHKRDAIEWGVIGGEVQHYTQTVDDAGGSSGNAALLKDRTGLGYGWGRAPRDGKGPKPLRSVWRDWAEAEEFKTTYELLTPEEIEVRENDKGRASRRLRRETSKFQTSARQVVGRHYRRGRE